MSLVTKGKLCCWTNSSTSEYAGSDIFRPRFELIISPLFPLVEKFYGSVCCIVLYGITALTGGYTRKVAARRVQSTTGRVPHPTMTTNDTDTKNSIDRADARDRARDSCHDAFFLGIDADGDRHYWSTYHFAAVIVRTDETKRVELPARHAPTDERLADLGDWVAYHDWADEPRYVDERFAAPEADA